MKQIEMTRRIERWLPVEQLDIVKRMMKRSMLDSLIDHVEPGKKFYIDLQETEKTVENYIEYRLLLHIVEEGDNE